MVLEVSTDLAVAATETLIFLIIPSLIKTLYDAAETLDHFKYSASLHTDKDINSNMFDFIVVGAGPAGSVVANRLSGPQNNYTVLLLEAGGDPNLLTNFPGLDLFNVGNPGIDWMYWSRPDIEKNSCLSCLNKRTRFSAGKGLGGGTNLNFMVYHRGNKKDWDSYAETTGDSSWSYKYMLEHFKNMENYKGPYPSSEFHGCGGELQITETFANSGASYFREALHEMGFTEKDHCANTNFTYQKMEYTSSRGFRWGSYKAFLEPVLSRQNLKIFRFSEVTKVIFDKKDPLKAIGVEYSRHGKGSRRAFARKEVILSAGGYNSAKILMLSGIGIKEDLEKLKIPSVKDLPVGKNFHDHIFTYSFYQVNSTELDSETPSVLDNNILPEISNFMFSSNISDKSILSSPLAGNNVPLQAHFSSPYNMDNDTSWPDLQYMVTTIFPWTGVPASLERLINLDRRISQKYMERATSKSGYVVLTSLNKIRSIGSITLDPRNLKNQPIINLNRFSDENDDDLNACAHGTKFARDLFANTETFKKIDGKMIDGHWPGCENYTLHSHEYFKCYVKHVHGHGWHPAGACKMGRDDDPTSVVDSRLRVLGIKNLRVIDNSILPKIVSGNTQAAAMVVGEKGAEMIIEDWQGVRRPIRRC